MSETICDMPAPGPAFVDTVRSQFPLLARKTRGKTLAYLDSASTTQKPQAVIDAMSKHYVENNANVHRGIYALAEKATSEYEKVRARVASFIHCKPDEVIFTSGTTGAMNLLAYSLQSRLSKGDEIIVSILEHHSNMVPWQELARRTGAVVKYAPLTADGQIDMKKFDSLLSGKTKIVSITHVSNVLGTIVDVKEIVKLAHKHGALVIVDGAQAIAHLEIDIPSLGCDFYAFSAHKMYGPTGVGVLYGRKELLEVLPPPLFGGEMIRTVTVEGSTWNDLPWKFEPGTPNIAGVIGLGAALTYLSSLDRAKMHAHEQAMVNRAVYSLSRIEGVTIFGPQQRAPLVSFAVAGIHAHDIAHVLDKHHVAVRAGHHCAMPLMNALGVEATVRASFGMYTTAEDIDRLIDGVQDAIKVLA